MLLMNMVRNWANIIEDLACRVDDALIQDCYVIDFDQTWGSTALGFGDIGGQMMTTERTYIIVIVHTNRAYVYFGCRYAYEVPYPFNKAFENDMAKHSLAHVVASQKYWRTDGN